MTAASQKVRVTQVRSTIRHQGKQLLTLKALGLGRIGKSQEHTLSPAVRGMIKSVRHLVVVDKA